MKNYREKANLYFFLIIFLLFFSLRGLSLAKNIDVSTIATSNPKYVMNENFNNILKLKLKIFLGTNDLESAYQICQEGMTYFPKDSYWPEWLGTLSIWMGNTSKGIDYYYKAFLLNGNISLAKKIYKLSISNHRWDMAERILEVVGDSVSLKDKVYVYTKAGNPERLIKFLQKDYKKRQSKEVLDYLIYTYWDIGDIKETIRTLDKLENNFGLNSDEVLMYVNALVTRKDYDKALDLLKQYSTKINKNDYKFWDKLSDLAWRLGDYKTSVDASMNLVNLKQEHIFETRVKEDGSIAKVWVIYRPGRISDYERIYQYYSKTKPQIAMKYALFGWKIYHTPNFLYDFTYIASQEKMWNSVLQNVNSLSKNDFDSLSNNIYFLVAYIDALGKTGHMDKAKNLCLNRLNKNFQPELLSELIYLGLNSNDQSLLKYITKRWSKEIEYYPTLVPSFISLYIYFENGQKALELSKYLKQNPTLDNRLIYADILSLYGNEHESIGIRYNIWVEMKKQLKSNPKLIYNQNFLENFLSLSMRFDNYKEFNHNLELSKKILPSTTYSDFKLSYELFRNNMEKTLYLEKKYKYILKPWMMLDIALWSKNTYLEDKLLKEWSDILPIRDRVEAFSETGDIGNAFDYAFKGLEANRSDSLLYNQFRDLAEKYSNNVNLSTQYINWDGYREILESISSRYYLSGGIVLMPFAKIGKEISYNSGNIINVPYKHYNIGITFRKQYANCDFKATAGVIGSIDTNPYFSINPECNITDSTKIGFLYGEHIEDNDNIYLYLGGLKRELEVTLSQDITQRTYLSVSASHNWILSQDSKTIGSNNGFYSELDYRLKESYPDFTLRTFIQSERYYQNGGEGDIEKFLPNSTINPLPSSYNMVGVGFTMGNNYKGKLEKTWRPFLNGDLFYETHGGTGYDLGGGYGGSMFGNDNLSIGTSYYTNFNGSSSSYFQFAVGYKIYF